MLFNSYVFVLCFLPLTLLVFYAAGNRWGAEASRFVLLAASLVFFVWWNPIYVLLLLGSVSFNFYCAQVLQKLRDQKKYSPAKNILIIGIVINLLTLGYYKYTNFFIANVNMLASTQFPLLEIVLPLAISFFTFTQIAFLVDVYEGLVEEKSWSRYLWFVAFFPHLIAGPIVRHRDVLPQFESDQVSRFNDRNFAYGLFVFSVGLFKKTVIADSLVGTVAAGFDGTGVISMADAWLASLAYTVQAYFDFSGYSDMAVGLGLLFNIRLPLNFNSPYKSTSIIQFWQRWHITLTDFINAYLYMPLMRLRDTFSFYYSLGVTIVVMAVVGLWHGASWNFVWFGLLHGVALVINHLWRRFGFSIHKILGWLLTLFWWNLTLVVFRSQTFEGTSRMLKGMFAGDGGFPARMMRDEWSLLKILPDPVFAVLLVIFFTAIFASCVLLKNPHEHRDRFSLSWRYFAITFICLYGSLLFMNHVTEFIYFQF